MLPADILSTTASANAGGLLNYDDVDNMLDSDHIAGLGLDVQWQEPLDPQDRMAKHPK